MKIGELDQHCGNCSIIEYCAEPFGLCLCCISELENLEESDYRDMAEKIQRRNKRNIDNSAMADRLCRKLNGMKMGARYAAQKGAAYEN